ncbi:glycosyl hydrolase [Kitasatospora sp. NPDC056181]|uniref:glycosyl hydrolase n=1 Tax=Kitasatospora sp. NPDC056181 TaxID=3345737 RepID=UPI0035D964B3
MNPKLDLRLDGLAPADQHTERLGSNTWLDDYEPLVQHDVGERSFVLALDTTATCGYTQGEPNITAFDVVRHPEQGTFSLRASAHANTVFAQKWLTDRGCPPESLKLSAFRPANELTTRVEDRILRSGDRYKVFERMAMDAGESEAWSLAIDSEVTSLPVCLFLEEIQPDHDTYTVREGAFPSYDVAEDWLADRPGPLPLAPVDLDPETKRTRAALARSSTASPSAPAAVPAPPTSAPAAQQAPRRPM